MIPICQNCNEKPCAENNAPKQIWSLTIPFTKIEIGIWRYAGYYDFCNECLIDRENDRFDKIFNAGFEAGW